MKTSCGLSSVNTSVYANVAKRKIRTNKRIIHTHICTSRNKWDTWNKNQHFRCTSSKNLNRIVIEMHFPTVQTIILVCEFPLKK